MRQPVFRRLAGIRPICGLFALYRRGKTLWNRRAARIRTAQEIIMTELDALDPIARAEVLKFVAERQLGISADADT